MIPFLKSVVEKEVADVRMEISNYRKSVSGFGNTIIGQGIGSGFTGGLSGVGMGHYQYNNGAHFSGGGKLPNKIFN